MMKYLIVFFLCLHNCIFSVSPIINLRVAKEHIHKKFEEAKVNEDPYPYLLIENILPDDLYNQIQYYWPESKCFSHQVGTNRHLYVTQGCTEWFPLTNDQRIFWRIYGEVVGRYIKEEIIKKLLPYLDWKFPWLSEEELENLKKELNFMNSRQDGLMEHHYGYQIPPHIDQIYLLATGLLYCPRDNSQEKLATLLFETPENVPFDEYYANLNPKLAKKIPFRKNSLLVMLENPWQLHGSAKHDVKDYKRKMYGFFINISPEQIEDLYKGHKHKFNLDWHYYGWEERFMKFDP